MYCFTVVSKNLATIIVTKLCITSCEKVNSFNINIDKVSMISIMQNI